MRTFPLFAPLMLALNLAHAQPAPTCQDRPLFGNERQFDCVIDLPRDAAPLRFVALFSGGHDDTMAALTMKLDGAEAACAAGSKTELMGEDGNVSLTCRVPADGVPEGRHLITVHLRWSHAQYEGFRFER